jgi:hypothetical protein
MATVTEPTAERATAERAAWRAYAASLRDLDGRDYEDVEHRSWERLQRRLREIALGDAPATG